jgi:SAM-dependent methyltransferase
MDITLRLAMLFMKWGNQHSAFGAQVCNTPSYIKPRNDQISLATRRAFDDGDSFFQRFEGTFSAQHLTAKDVLDIGSGCGGRTAYYLHCGNPRSIVGLDISTLRAGIAQQSVKALCDERRISFVVGVGEDLPFREASFDFVLSYDVFEHVENLRQVLQECYRILRPGGRLCALFPPYYGPRAHHLDFITTLPFLHHIFSPSVLVEAANRILEEQPALRDSPLPNPRRSYLGREVLPRLNGTTERDFREIVESLPFEVEQVTLVPFGWGHGGLAKRAVHLLCKAMLRLPAPFQRDVFVSTIRCVLRKPGSARA